VGFHVYNLHCFIGHHFDAWFISGTMDLHNGNMKNVSRRKNKKGNGPGYSPKKQKRSCPSQKKKKGLIAAHLQSNSNHNCLLQ